MSTLSTANASRWAKAKVKPEKRAVFKSVAERLAGPAAKARYVAVEKRTGVPWFVVAVIHEREASQSWSANIAQGDPWNAMSRHVPAGRGPFKSWEDAAYDALVNCAPYAGKWRDWSTGGTLELLERYNGLGYANKGVPSPYVWSGTDQYVSGKYVADHVYNANAVDQQLGCAGLILAMQDVDPSIIVGLPPKPPAAKPKITPEAAAATVIIGTGAGTAAKVHNDGHGAPFVIGIVFAAIVIGVIAWMAVRAFKRK